jgi:hypothetical protein
MTFINYALSSRRTFLGRPQDPHVFLAGLVFYPSLRQIGLLGTTPFDGNCPLKRLA